MAIYEYHCKKCKKNFEQTYSLGQAPRNTKCPVCQKKSDRIISIPMIKFVGSGFYVNDSKASPED